MTNMTMDEWKAKATLLYFENGFTIAKINEEIGISRRSISKHLNSLPEYKKENAKRKDLNKKMRKDYQRNWDRRNRPGRYAAVTGDTMRREHEVAVSVLSHEKY